MMYSIVTVSDKRPSQDYYCYDSFFRSLEKYSTEPLVLSNELMGTVFNGTGSKPNWQCRAIKEGLIKSKYVFFVDCWDLFFAEHPDKAFEKYLSFNSPIVFNSEKNCFPNFLKEDYDKLYNGTSSYKYLNSGMIVGETEAILTGLESMGAPNLQEDYRKENGEMFHQNDQERWLEVFLKQPVKMALDYNQEICQTLHTVNINEFELTDNGYRNKETGTIASIYHANGDGKSSGVKEPILKHLNLL